MTERLNGGHNLYDCRRIHFRKCGVCNKTIYGVLNRRCYCTLCKQSFHFKCKSRISEECPCAHASESSTSPLPAQDTTGIVHEPETDFVISPIQEEPRKRPQWPPFVEELLKKYGEDDPDHPGELVIGPQGLLDLCNSLGIDLLDVKGLILLWLANASDGGMLTGEEVNSLVTSLDAHSESDILPGLVEVSARVDKSLEDLEKMFDYGFISCKDTSYARNVDAKMCAEMLNIVLGKRPQFHHVKSFVEFLSSGVRQKVNADEWHCIYNFCLKFGDDLSSYDDTSSWPCVIDEFVEYSRNKSITKD